MREGEVGNEVGTVEGGRERGRKGEKGRDERGRKGVSLQSFERSQILCNLQRTASISREEDYR